MNKLAVACVLMLALSMLPLAKAESVMEVPKILTTSEKEGMTETGSIIVRVPTNTIRVVINAILIEAPDGTVYNAKLNMGFDLLADNDVRGYNIPHSFEGMKTPLKPGVYKVIFKGYLDNEKHIEEQTFTVINIDRPDNPAPGLKLPLNLSFDMDSIIKYIVGGLITVGIVALIYGIKKWRYKRRWSKVRPWFIKKY